MPSMPSKLEVMLANMQAAELSLNETIQERALVRLLLEYINTPEITAEFKRQIKWKT